MSNPTSMPPQEEEEEMVEEESAPEPRTYDSDEDIPVEERKVFFI